MATSDITNINDFESGSVKHLYGFYRAQVINNKDPYYYGRVLIHIPDLFIDIPEHKGLWALPANNPLGGRNTNMPNEKTTRYGSLYIPELGSWVWIFFEGGNMNNPYYFGSLDILNTQVPPENTKGDEYQLKWTIIRTTQGRVIVASDDPFDERVEITGKKANIDDVFSIDDNMKTILIDERLGKEKILIKDEKGNYINIDTANQKIHINSNSDYNQHCGGNYSISCDGDVKFDIGGDLSFNVAGQIHIASSDVCRIQAKHLHLQEGASPKSPNTPIGNRD